jgi:hypothetical protein
MTPGLLQREKLIKEIESLAARHNRSNGHNLIFLVVNWAEMHVIMHYRACCGGKVPKKFYKKIESAIKKINMHFNVQWKYRE